MEKKDKRILIITSGVFLVVLVFILFLTMQSRDNMMCNAGRYKGTEVRLGDNAGGIENCASASWSCDDSSGYTAISGECRKLTETNVPQSMCESTSGLLWSNGKCYSMSDVSSSAKIWTCNECDSGFELRNGVCTVNTNQGCCYKIGTTWYFEENDENCSDLGATIGNKDKTSCLAQNSSGGETTTKKCNAGEYLPGQSTSCVTCPAGYSCSGGTYTIGDSSPSGLTQCTGTTYASGGATTCETCTGTIVKNGGLNVGCTTDKVTCGGGEYLPGQSTSCATCPAGYSCSGGTYTIGDSSPSGLTQCTGTTYASGGATTCETCTGTIVKNGELNVGCTATTGCNPGEYQIKQDDGSFRCETCPNGYIATTAVPYCHIVIAAGSYLVGGTSETRTCPVNTYSAGGTYLSSGGCMSGGDCTIDSCHACPDGTTSPMGSTNRNACVSSTGKCTITASTNASRVSYGDSFNVSVSVNGDGCNGRTMTVSATGGTTTSNSYSISNGQGFNFTVTASEQTTCTANVTFSANAGDAGDSVSVETIRDWHLSQSGVCMTETDFNTQPHSVSDADSRPTDIYYIATNNNDCGSGSRKVDIYVRGCGSGPSNPTTKYCCRTEGTTGNTYSPNQTSCTAPAKVYTGTCRETPACYLRNSDNTYVTGSFKDRDGYTPVDSSKCSSTPVTPVTEEKACYVKYGNGTNNQYCYNTASNCAGYTKVNRSEAMCKETPACYLNKNDGKYYTGSFSNQSNYSYYGTTCPKEACYIKPDGTYEWTDSPVYGSSLVSAVNSEANCKPAVVTPPPSTVTQYACYVNTNKTDYKWNEECTSSQYFDGTSCKAGTNSSTDPSKIYSKDSMINNATSCRAPQTPGCYINLSTGSYTWGLYDNIVGYNHVSSITTQSKCVDPSPACYVDSVGNYVWGRYENDSNYTVISSITTQSACKRVISNVPKTDLDVSTVIYIAIVVLSVFGVGFVYYANSKKKLYK